MLTFVGLGLYDERDVTLKGRDAIADADRVYAEFYTSVLPAAPIPDLEDFHGVAIERLSRSEVEEGAERLLDEAEDEDVVLLVGGDPMVSTTHADLRLRAIERGIGTSVIHGQSIQSAVCGATGLQNYRFGASTTLPFDDGWTPTSPFETIAANRDRDHHTLLYLDIDDVGADDGDDERRFLRASDAADRVAAATDDVPMVIGVARAGSGDPAIVVGSPDEVADRDLGPPLHVMIVPGSLHEVERTTLAHVADGTIPGEGKG